ncbi:MAG: hypothetical protein R2867_22265 [Caldilineaceae bacterium]
MNRTLERAQDAINDPVVKDCLEKLAEFGLGVFIPHIHLENGRMEPLPEGYVQIERNLQVSFSQEGDLQNEQMIAVGWFWDEKIKEVRVVAKCC